MSLAVVSFKMEVDNLELCWVRLQKEQEVRESVLRPSHHHCCSAVLIWLVGMAPAGASDQQEEEGSITSAYDIYGGKLKTERCCYTAPATERCG